MISSQLVHSVAGDRNLSNVAYTSATSTRRFDAKRTLRKQHLYGPVRDAVDQFIQQLSLL